MLLEERERRREREAQGRQAFRLPQAPPPYVAHAPVVQFGARAPTFDWMHDPGVSTVSTFQYPLGQLC